MYTSGARVKGGVCALAYVPNFLGRLSIASKCLMSKDGVGHNPSHRYKSKHVQAGISLQSQ